MKATRTKQGVHAWLLSVTRRTTVWMRVQLVEIGDEICQAIFPPLRVRRLPGGALAIAASPEFGGLTTVLSVHAAPQVRVAPPEVAALVDGRYTGGSDALVAAWRDQIHIAEPNRWGQWSVELVSAVVPALVALRDRGVLTIDRPTLLRYLTLEPVYELAHREDVPVEARERLQTMLRLVPTFKADRGAHQSSSALEQFCNCAMSAILTLQRPAASAESVEVRSYSSSGPGFLIARFPNHAMAEQGIELISNALVGGRGKGGWMLLGVGLSVAMAILLMFFVTLWVAATAADKVEKNTLEEPAPVGDVLRDAFGGSANTAAAVASTPAVPMAGGESLAEHIYTQAMAASQQSAYEAGPPQSPIENPQAGDFGLGVSGKEGCDPALKFTVAAQP